MDNFRGFRRDSFTELYIRPPWRMQSYSSFVTKSIRYNPAAIQQKNTHQPLKNSWFLHYI
jgi:hypothetical protein